MDMKWKCTGVLGTLNIKNSKDSKLYITTNWEGEINNFLFKKPKNLIGIKIEFDVVASNREEAIKKAEDILNTLCLTFTLIRNLPVFILDLNVSREGIVLKDKLIANLGLGEGSIKEIIDKYKKLQNMNFEIRKYIIRFLNWYRYGLFEEKLDEVNAFVMFWTALEVWKSYLSKKQNFNYKKAMMYLFKKILQDV